MKTPQPRHSPAPAHRAAEAPGSGAGARRGAVALWLTLAALALARATLAFIPSMTIWALNLQRFLTPAAGWGLWAIAAAPLVPPVAGRLVGPLERWGDLASRGPVLAACFAGAAAAALVAWLPDRLWFVGDFLMLRGTVIYGKDFMALFPQTMPLDLLLHARLPRALASAGWLGMDAYARALGAVEAALLAALATAFARALGLRGAAAAAAAAVVIFGGYLLMFAGYPKSASELCLLTAAIGLCTLLMAREGRGAAALGLALAAGLAVHRSALVFFPTAALAWGLWFRDRARERAWRPAETMAGLAIPAATLVWLGPRLLDVLRGFDVPHHLASEAVRAQGGMWRAALADGRPVDLANVVLALCPLAAILPAAAFALGPGILRRRETWLLGTLAGSLLASMLVIHPQQGLFRDWDVFAPAGVALALLAAFWIGEALGAVPGRAWLAPGMALAAVTTSAGWLLSEADLGRGLERVAAFTREPPPRADVERAKALDFLGDRYAERGRWSDAADALRRATQLAPSPRLLTAWALAETERGDLGAARDIYRQLVARDPGDLRGWAGLASSSSDLGDRDQALLAARELLRRKPGDGFATGVLDYWESRAATDSVRKR